MPFHRNSLSFCRIFVKKRHFCHKITCYLEQALPATQFSCAQETKKDIGGPTANMYGFGCARKTERGACPDRRCLFPACCPALKPNHSQLLQRLRGIPGVRKVFVAPTSSQRIPVAATTRCVRSNASSRGIFTLHPNRCRYSRPQTPPGPPSCTTPASAPSPASPSLSLAASAPSRRRRISSSGNSG